MAACASTLMTNLLRSQTLSAVGRRSGQKVSGPVTSWGVATGRGARMANDANRSAAVTRKLHVGLGGAGVGRGRATDGHLLDRAGEERRREAQPVEVEAIDRPDGHDQTRDGQLDLCERRIVAMLAGQPVAIRGRRRP